MFSPFSESAARKMGLVIVGGVLAGIAYVLAVLWLLYRVERAETLPLVLAVALCVPGYAMLSLAGGRDLGFRIGLALRVAALFAFPLLSDDIYRFLWDGALWWEGIHPFGATPTSVITSAHGAAFAKTHGEWLANMNSADYFTVYPPLSQLVFATAGGLSSDTYWASVFLKVPLFAGELGVWWLLPRLMGDLRDRYEHATLYWLNPLVIVEVIGNAHFEGLALLFVLLGLYAIRRAGLGWARQGWVAVGKAREHGFGPKYPTYMRMYVGPGLEPAEVAAVPSVGSRVWWTWLLLASGALAAAVLVKLVPLILAPALTLMILWRWTGRPVYDHIYYDFLPQVWQERIVSLANSDTSVGIDPTARGDRPMLAAFQKTNDALSEEDRYVLTRKWPYGHPYEVIPPDSAELYRLRLSVLRRAAGMEVGAREEAEQFAIAHGGGPVAFPLLRGRRVWSWWPAVGFGASLLLGVSVALTLMLLGSGISGFGESLNLYFQKFEFNGGLYAVGRALGYWYKGFNWIAIVGPALSALGVVLILGISVYRSWRGLDFVETLLWCVTAYLACATTVHPWYFVYLIGLGCLTRYRWPMLLGCTAFLSYAAYGQAEVSVPVWALVLEYGSVGVFAGIELMNRVPRRYASQPAVAKTKYSVKKSAHIPR